MSNNEMNIPVIEGFSKLSRRQKIEMVEDFTQIDENLQDALDSWLPPEHAGQEIFEGFIENYLTNYHLPMGIVPNMVINGKSYMVPLVTEESSVIAAASRAAKFWAQHGGFQVKITGTEKKGQIHFTWNGDKNRLINDFASLRQKMLKATEPITQNMSARGGGITTVELLDKTSAIPNYFQVDVSFETADAMGANFINSCLETMARELKNSTKELTQQGNIEIIMSILSNHTPDSLAECTVECDIEQLSTLSGDLSPQSFARKFELANRIAVTDVSRAVTHNKGIYNGVDALILATGNDWRAVEACGHAYASAGGSYRALTETTISERRFRHTLRIPMAPGTVGGLTKAHPLARLALRVLGNPGAKELMKIAAATGMASNFSAITSLITTGIQKGHMKMHLPNILKQLQASEPEAESVSSYFSDKEISYAAVQNFLTRLRIGNEK